MWRCGGIAMSNLRFSIKSAISPAELRLGRQQEIFLRITKLISAFFAWIMQKYPV
jgi:hypothetical protein